MDALSALLPPQPPPMALTVNGRPLNDVLTVIANALRSQQEEIKHFKEMHAANMAEVGRRLGELDGRIARIETDLQIHQRPFVAYGQPAMATAYDAIATMEYRVHRSSTAVRANIEADIATTYTKALLQRYFKKLHVYAIARMAVKKMAGQSRAHTMGSVWARWLKSVALFKKQRSNERKVAALLYTANKKLAACYLNKYLTWHNDLNARLEEKRVRDVRVSNDLAAFNLRGVVRRFFNKWAQYQEHLKYNAERYRQAQRLEVMSHRAIAMNAYERWVEFTNYRLFEIRRHRAIATRHKQALRALVLRYLGKWRQFVGIQQARQAKYVLVSRMYHSATMRLARRYFGKILRFVTLMQQRRRTEELAAYLTLLAKKYDTMGEQLDLSLDNLSHTNGVLSRVVDTIILTNPDAPQVQSLLGIHRGDQTINSRVTTRYEVEEQIGAKPTTTRGMIAAKQQAIANGHSDSVNTAAIAAPLPARHQDLVPPPTASSPSAPSMTRIVAAAYNADGSSVAGSRHTSAQRSNSNTLGGSGRVGAHAAVDLPHVQNRRQRMFSPGNSRENPENRILSVRDLISGSPPTRR